MITQINAILEIYFRRDLSETDARLPDLLALNAHFSTMLTSQGTKFSFMDFIRDDKYSSGRAMGTITLGWVKLYVHK